MSNTQTERGRGAHVLLVEDNDDDVELLKVGFARARFAGQLHHVSDGIDGLAFLRKQGAFANAPTPDLVLLDLNMPRQGGLETLAQIVSDEDLKHLVVVILTSSELESDILAAYRLRCNSFVVKPVDFNAFTKSIDMLIDSWFTLAALPARAV